MMHKCVILVVINTFFEGNFEIFRDKYVMPVLQSFRDSKLLKSNEGRLFNLYELRSDSKEEESEQKLDIFKFNQSVKISAFGMSLLRSVHKQVMKYFFLILFDIVY
jgi:hypothetical protein